MTLPVEWMPASPLKYDSTDDQINLRVEYVFVMAHRSGTFDKYDNHFVQVARELAAAVQAEADKKIDAIVTDGGIVAVLEAHHAAEVRIAALESQLASARKDALDEAAQLCEDFARVQGVITTDYEPIKTFQIERAKDADFLAKEIRALRFTPPPGT